MFAIEPGEVTADGHALQLLEKHAALASASETKFSHQLFVASLAARGAADVAMQFAIFHVLRVGHLRAHDGASIGNSM